MYRTLFVFILNGNQRPISQIQTSYYDKVIVKNKMGHQHLLLLYNELVTHDRVLDQDEWQL